MAGGRPTKYKPEYCEALVSHMNAGKSFETFAAQCDCSIETIYEWTRVHEEFSEAKKKGVAKAMDYWETLGHRGVNGEIHNFNMTGWIYTMKCRFYQHWGDKQTVSHVIDDRRETKQLSDQDLNNLLVNASPH